MHIKALTLAPYKPRQDTDHSPVKSHPTLRHGPSLLSLQLSETPAQTHTIVTSLLSCFCWGSELGLRMRILRSLIGWSILIGYQLQMLQNEWRIFITHWNKTYSVMPDVLDVFVKNRGRGKTWRSSILAFSTTVSSTWNAQELTSVLNQMVLKLHVISVQQQIFGLAFGRILTSD